MSKPLYLPVITTLFDCISPNGFISHPDLMVHNWDMYQNQDHLFKGYCFPPSISQYAVWRYFTFPLSFRDVELMLAQRSIQVSHESIRK